MNKEVKELLNNINCKYKDYYVQDIVSGDDLKLLSDYIINLQQEIERLNKIINKLQIESYLGILENTANNDYSKGLNTAYEYINNKIKELKGSDE